MNADQLLNDLGLAMGLPNLRFDAQGCARLMFDGKTAIDLENDTTADSLQIYCVLGPLPAEGREALFKTLLQANLFGTGTHGATLAVDSLHNEVVLCRTVVPDSMSTTGFTALMEKFVTSAEHWRTNLGGAADGGASAPPAPLEVPRFDAFLRA